MKTRTKSSLLLTVLMSWMWIVLAVLAISGIAALLVFSLLHYHYGGAI